MNPGNIVLQPWIDVADDRGKERDRTPIVTVFGAGIGGLTAAHELVERGFAVQVVEPAAHPDRECEVRVGGLAATQLARTPADVDRLHPYLFPEEEQQNDVEDDQGERGVRLWVRQQGDGETLDIEVNGQPISPPYATGTKLPAEIAAELASQIDALDGVNAHAIVVLGGSAQVHVLSDTPGRVPTVSIKQAATENASIVLAKESTAPLADLRAVEMRAAQPRFPVPERIQFERAGTGNWLDLADEHGTSNRLKLDQVYATLRQAWAVYGDQLATDLQQGGLDSELSPRMRAREHLAVEIRGHTDQDGPAKANRALSLEWANKVRLRLLVLNQLDPSPIPGFRAHLVLVPVGDAEPLGNPRRARGRRRSNRVEFRIVENRIPGEHGYRFFPRFYRHLFDTMERTPILDRRGRESGDTALDQVRSADLVDLALPNGKEPLSLPVRPKPSLEALRELLELHLGKEVDSEQHLGVGERDLARFQVKLLKFLTASKARRAKDYERETWWEFIGGDAERGYSQNMAALLRDTPQALVSMRADETDARSQGVVYCQLLLDAVADGERVNGTLNGPTTDAWLAHWKRYLRRQGVRFFQGEVKQLRWAQGNPSFELVPVVGLPQTTAVSAEIVVFASEPYEYKMFVNGIEVAFQGNPSTSIGSVVGALADAIDANMEMAAVADRSSAGAGRLGVRARYPAGNAILRVLRGDRTPNTVEVVGLRVVAQAERRDQLRTALWSGIRDLVDTPLAVDELGEASLRVGPRDGEQVISVKGEVAGEYGVRVNGVPVTIEAELPGLGRVGESDRIGFQSLVREQLAQALSIHFENLHLDVTVARLGANALRIAPGRGDAPLPPIDVTPWSDRMVLGPLVLAEPHREQLGDRRVLANTNLEVLRGDRVDLRVEAQGLAVATVLPEEPQHAYLEQKLDESQTPPALLDSPGGGPDFYVLALPFESVSRLVWDAHHDKPTGADLDGCLGELMDFDVRTGRRDPVDQGGAERPLQRDAAGRPYPISYPLRDLSGIQYYFENQVRVGLGHTYYHGAPWGLSSISQLAYWRTRLAARSAFLGQLSVDIGSWYQSVYDEHGVPAHAPTWRSGQREIALEVWRQIKAGIERVRAQHLVSPTYYHLDQGIRFAQGRTRQFGAAVEVTVSDLTQPSYQLVVGGTTISVSGSADGTPATDIAEKLAEKIREDTAHAAGHFGPDRLVIAPAARQPEGALPERRVRVVVLETATATDYKLRVGDPHIEPPVQAALGDDPNTVRDKLVAAIHAAIPGALAAPDPSTPGALVLNLGAPDRAVSALAAKIVNGDLESYLVVDPPGVVTLAIPADMTDRLEIADDARATPTRNATPFLINTPDDAWKWRPGLYERPTSPQPAGAKAPTLLDASLAGVLGSRLADKDDPPYIWYRPTLRRWLSVGNHMATFTRMSTMESSNESARHAVIAMLHALVTAELPAGGSMAPLGSSNSKPIYNGQGHLLGDLPTIWDPEEHELIDAGPLKRIDARLVADGQPHFLEIFRVEDWIDGLPDDLVHEDLAKQLEELIAAGKTTVEADWKFGTADEVGEALRAVGRALLGLAKET